MQRRNWRERWRKREVKGAVVTSRVIQETRGEMLWKAIKDYNCF